MNRSKRKRQSELIVAEMPLRKSAIPEYLKQGELYRTLTENNDDPNEEVTFPVEVLKPNTQVVRLADCDHLLNSLRFWGVEKVGSAEITSYVLNCTESHERIDALMQKYEKEFKWIFWLRQVMLADSYDRSIVAIQSGMIELVEPVFVSSHIDKKQPLPEDACDLAVEVGNLEVMQFLCESGCKINGTTIKTAARRGHISIFLFLVEKGHQLANMDLVAAIEGGHLACVQTIHKLIGPVCKEASWSCYTAAKCGNLEILQYLHSEEFAWNACTTAAAAGGGHLHCLQYLHEHGCPWMTYTCAVAAGRGHLLCLQYAHQHGCPIDNFVAAEAVEGGHPGCLRYAHNNGSAWTYEKSGGTEQVCFVVYRMCVVRIRTPYSSPQMWDYLRMHATNTVEISAG